MNVESLDIHGSIKKALLYAGHQTLGDVASLYCEQVLKIDGINTTSFHKLRKCINRRGYHFIDEENIDGLWVKRNLELNRDKILAEIVSPVEIIGIRLKTAMALRELGLDTIGDLAMIEEPESLKDNKSISMTEWWKIVGFMQKKRIQEFMQMEVVFDD